MIIKPPRVCLLLWAMLKNQFLLSCGAWNPNVPHTPPSEMRTVPRPEHPTTTNLFLWESLYTVTSESDNSTATVDVDQDDRRPTREQTQELDVEQRDERELHVVRRAYWQQDITAAWQVHNEAPTSFHMNHEILEWVVHLGLIRMMRQDGKRLRQQLDVTRTQHST